MSILLIVLSWAVFAFMTWFTYQFIRDMIAASKKRKPMATMNGKINVYHEGATNPKRFYTRAADVELLAIGFEVPKQAPKKKPKAMTAPIKRNKPKPAVKKAKSRSKK